ncbi:homoserine dehydrogenase [Actinobaculum sp. oral taxon 183 str. F0552]|uniref:homoserine dehydrogenase n=1 Tax=Actinobaculum sp. oral taxon 183 TaxID=712888 RepID=UPI000397B950|nr:homoserine dehydrogenase [Actinobaculum sp. oral taxon 183]ERH18784.1 homoserine dehydrogenase [Actinobaculum sp. oral taxon 183 str. F0552]
MKDVRIGLLGCGTVGTQVARLLEEQSQDLAARSGARLKVVAIAVRDLEAPRDPAIDRGLLTDDPHRVISQADIVIELIGGVEPARSLILEAFRTGASVVTGNKALLAAHGPELYQAAAAAGVDLYYEAAVAGAVPVVYGLRESLAGDRIMAVLGIVNGTTNYILDEMTTKGMDFGEALAKAQELGYAEADPSADVDGLDAAAKCAILASLAFHTRVALDDVHVHGIRHITADDVATAARSGCVVKLIASAKRRPDGIELHVGPTLVPATHPLASVHGPFNAIVIEAEAADRLMFYGRGAGGAPTASAVLSDVVAAASHRVDGGHAPRELVYADLRVLAPQEGRSRFQVEFTVLDEVGVLTRVTSAFASHGVSIRSVVQGVGEGGLARLTATTHEACQADLEATLAELSSAPFVAEVHHVNRVEES